MSDFQKKLLVRLAILVGVVAVLCGGILFFGGKISAYASEIASTRTELVRWASSLQSYVSIKSQYEGAAKGDTEILNNLIPQQDKLIDLRKDFQFLAGGNNLGVSFSFAGERMTASPHLGAIGINLNLQGNMDDIFSFIKKLQDFHYLISIGSVTIEKKDKETGSVGLVRGEVFFQK